MFHEEVQRVEIHHKLCFTIVPRCRPFPLYFVPLEFETCCYVTSEFAVILSSQHHTLRAAGQNTQETVVTVNSPVIINMQ